MGSNYSRAKPVAKGKTSRDYHRVITADAILGVPNKVRLDAYYIVKNIMNVAVAARINIFRLASFTLYNYTDR
jgi:hypothetical protein